MDNTEIEVKYKVKDKNRLYKWLNNNAKIISNSVQKDLYFDPPVKSYIYTDKTGKKTAKEYIRVRMDKNKNSFCYKFIDKDREFTEQLPITEIETRISDPERITEILKKLGFKKSITIHKTRSSYKYQNFQIDVDIVKNLGEFVEIEYKGEMDRYQDGYKKINNLLKDIGIEDWPEAKGGYVELILNKE